MKLYTKQGWVNWGYIDGLGSIFNMVIGARGVGKTYGLFKYLIEQGKPFVYLRRLQTQLDMCGTESGNPFRKIASDLQIEIKTDRAGKLIEFKREEDIIALGCSLSTLATVRGFDFSGYDYIVFDECVPMIGEKPIKDEFNSFLNFYETVNRNRELSGEVAVKCFMLGNANQLINPYFVGWGFMRKAVKMIRSGEMIYRSRDKTRSIILLLKSPISEKKKGTALYQNAGNDFIQMAIDNAFRTDETKIASKPLKEYKHIVSVGEIGIYKHKSTGEYYISSVTQIPKYEGYGMPLKLFQNDFGFLKSVYLIKQNFVFESYENEIMFREYFKLN